MSLLVLAAGTVLWHALTISQMTAENPARWRAMATHVRVRGYPTYCRTEDDGDRHIRLCDSPDVEGMDRAHCIVLECIPQLPCACPRLGVPLEVDGISRYDGEHRWWEIHPVLARR